MLTGLLYAPSHCLLLTVRVVVVVAAAVAAADVLEAALKARAALAPQIPKARAAVAATTATARKLRGAVMLTKLAAGVFDIGRAVRMQLIVAAADQVLQRETQQRQQQQSGRSQLKGRQKKQPKPDQQQ